MRAWAFSIKFCCLLLVASLCAQWSVYSNDYPSHPSSQSATHAVLFGFFSHHAPLFQMLFLQEEEEKEESTYLDAVSLPPYYSLCSHVLFLPSPPFLPPPSSSCSWLTALPSSSSSTMSHWCCCCSADAAAASPDRASGRKSRAASAVNDMRCRRQGQSLRRWRQREGEIPCHWNHASLSPHKHCLHAAARFSSSTLFIHCSLPRHHSLIIGAKGALPEANPCAIVYILQTRTTWTLEGENYASE